MGDVREEPEEFLNKNPEIERDIPGVVTVDDQKRVWSFADLPMDSGVFGELVASGVAEEHADGYRLADRRAVVAALDGETASTDGESGGLVVPSLPTGTKHPPTLAAVAAVLATVIGFRSTIAGSVFTPEGVVLPGNDP